MSRKAQSWSVDLVLGVVIFLLVIVIIYSLIASRPAKENQLRDEADQIYIKLSSEEDKLGSIPKILEGNTISEEELAKLYQTDYQLLKKELGITDDFCIVIITDNGGLITIGDNSSVGNKQDILIGNSLYCGD